MHWGCLATRVRRISYSAPRFGFASMANEIDAANASAPVESEGLLVMLPLVLYHLRRVPTKRIKTGFLRLISRQKPSNLSAKCSFWHPVLVRS